MPSLNEIRSQFLDYFGARDHAVIAFGARWCRRAIRPCCSSTPAWCRSRTSSPAPRRRPRRAPPPRRSASAPAASTTTSTTSATPPATTPSSRCWATSRSATTSRTARSSCAWKLITEDFAIDASRLLVTVHVTDEEAAGLWRKIAGLPTSGSSASRPPTTSGRWATPAPAARARRSSTTTATISPAGRPDRPDEDGDRFTEIWNLVFMQFEQLADGRAPRPAAARASTPAWAWSASPPSCRACTTTTTSTCSAR